MILYPSIASANPLALLDALHAIEQWPYLHIDIEDGNFVPNITFGMRALKRIAEASPCRAIDVHLMCNDPCRYLGMLAEAGITSVSAHIEALPYPMEFINRAHRLGMRAGLALNIKTPMAAVEPFLALIDHILTMSAEPDECGETLYMPAVAKAVAMKARLPATVDLFVDGGLNEDAVKQLNRAGITGVVLGRFVFDSREPMAALNGLADALQTDLPPCEAVRPDSQPAHAVQPGGLQTNVLT